MEEFTNLEHVYERLKEITQNEVELGGYLLPYKREVVDCILEQIEHMSGVIEKMKSRRMSPFCIEQQKFGLKRFNYLVSTYLRTRLKKIEANASFLIKLLKTDRHRALRFMSKLEAEYLDRFNVSIDNYMKNVLKDMPVSVQGFKHADVSQSEKLDYAFVLGCSDAKIVDGQSEVALEPDVCRILSVPTIIDLLERGSRDFKII